MTINQLIMVFHQIMGKTILQIKRQKILRLSHTCFDMPTLNKNITYLILSYPRFNKPKEVQVCESLNIFCLLICNIVLPMI
jgi:hypothetical protein